MYFDELPLGTKVSLDTAPADLRETAMAAIANEHDASTRAIGHYNLGFLHLLTDPPSSSPALRYFEDARHDAFMAGDQTLIARASRQALTAYFAKFHDEVRNRLGLCERAKWFRGLENLRNRAQTDAKYDPDARVMLLWTIAVQELHVITLLVGIGEPAVAKEHCDRLEERVKRLSRLKKKINPDDKPISRRVIQILEVTGALRQFIDRFFYPIHELATDAHLAAIFRSASSPP